MPIVTATPRAACLLAHWYTRDPILTLDFPHR
ncbi:hypothetical protein OPFLODJI_02117 [Aeromonas hydrophila]|jgi:hypothetical protein|nr:hypothetical protein [Aeromonas hydrophila]MCS3792912.1 hypothetical protein [Aeromonas hydrophila]